MATKLGKSSFPAGHGPNDFKCFGPPASVDGQFDNCKIADMGSFAQEEIDSNKYYHSSVCQSTQTQKWYAYFEWGRVGATKPQFQFVECASEAEAQREFAAQCHEKNDKRGVWDTIAGIRTLKAKPGKDVYLVRQLATRSTGLPDVKTIKSESATAGKSVVKKTITASIQMDLHTDKLLRDLMGGTVAYTRGSMADSSLPTQNSIDNARIILLEAQKRVALLPTIQEQIADRELRELSGELYRRIPKRKPVGTPDAVWILSRDNILMWTNDLDAYESAVVSVEVEDRSEVEPYYGLPLKMKWVDPTSNVGKFLHYWWPRATANKHGGIGQMKILNLWQVERNGDEVRFSEIQNKIISSSKGEFREKPLFQPNERPDLKNNELHKKSNTGLLLHGTRSVNALGILREHFRLPKELRGVALAGANFGEGVYHADDWKKSAGYTSIENSYWARGGGVVPGRKAFMFATDVALGHMHVAPGSRGYTSPPANHHSVFAKGSNHYKDNSGVQNNEFIVFNPAQCSIKYLCEFTV